MKTLPDNILEIKSLIELIELDDDPNFPEFEEPLRRISKLSIEKFLSVWGRAPLFEIPDPDQDNVLCSGYVVFRENDKWRFVIVEEMNLGYDAESAPYPTFGAALYAAERAMSFYGTSRYYLNVATEYVQTLRSRLKI